jgi:hypothetical protein
VPDFASPQLVRLADGYASDERGGEERTSSYSCPLRPSSGTSPQVSRPTLESRALLTPVGRVHLRSNISVGSSRRQQPHRPQPTTIGPLEPSDVPVDPYWPCCHEFASSSNVVVPNCAVVMIKAAPQRGAGQY